MEPIDIIILIAIVLIIGCAVAYIIKAKMSGKRCIGCPDSATCKSSCSGSCSTCACGCGTKLHTAENTAEDNAQSVSEGAEATPSPNTADNLDTKHE